MKTFSLAYATCRPDAVADVVQLWRSRADHPEDVEVVIGVDSPQRAQLPELPGCQIVEQPEAPFNCVKAWNAAAAATTGKVIIAMADDFSPPEHWDSALLASAGGAWTDTDAALWVSDGYNPDMMTLAILTRVRYRKFGYLWYPGYESMFCDTEFTAVALRDGAVRDCRHLTFEHLHPDAGKRPRDASDLVHASKERWWRGETLFNLRQAANFPNDTGLGQSSEIAPDDIEFVAYFQVVRDDLCLVESCQRLYDEGVRRFFFALPDRYWSGEPVSQEDQDSVTRAVNRIQRFGQIHLVTRSFAVTSYQFPGDSRIKVETRLRNAALAEIRRNGFRHILVLDADELWPVGVVEEVHRAVQQGVTALACPMIPVIGLPGYPVAGAKDIAVVYMGGSRIFFDCRSPAGTLHALPVPIYHFTATRRTREEIAIKHRQSGHYDDPRYSMEEWVETVLPAIKPGPAPTLRGGQPGWHMFLEHQIWPTLRHWTAGELANIPTSLHPFLGVPQ